MPIGSPVPAAATMRLKRLFRRNGKHRVYLRVCQVLPSSTFAEYWELRPELGPTDSQLQRKFGEWLNLPKMEQGQDVDKNDLFVDVYLKEFRSGQIIAGEIGDIPIGILWRPRAEVAAIVTAADTSKVVARASTTYKMPWLRFIKLALTPRALFLGVGATGSQTADFLVGGALIKLFSELKTQL